MFSYIYNSYANVITLTYDIFIYMSSVKVIEEKNFKIFQLNMNINFVGKNTPTPPWTFSGFRFLFLFLFINDEVNKKFMTICCIFLLFLLLLLNVDELSAEKSFRSHSIIQTLWLEKWHMNIKLIIYKYVDCMFTEK